ncbi:hypothetical protein DL239_18835 [Sedimentitalea sp. CY04]|uniref:Uncharacterized protein n=1 Tax=Parasedimentitalea denitrificans TaxID=2211118 RepID=A0ABX0WBH9_9RHOB|nr:hypothetical protein [Sedimentitalea sp. CY04]NIZ63025.1 hypothetical protein [Sedimentitalea sp. CY04]
MTDLVLLTFGDDEIVRCTSLNDAKAKVVARAKISDKVSVKITPAGGGPVTSLKFDSSSGDWLPDF